MPDRRQTLEWWVEELELASQNVPKVAFPEGGDGVDLLGRIRKVEVDLGEFRRGALAETPDDERGRAYRVDPGYKRTYSFNWPRILKDLAEAIDADGYTVLDAFMLLLLGDGERPGAIKAEGSIQKLRRIAEAYGMALQVSPGEIDVELADLDAPHVGYTEKRTARVVGITQ